MVKTNHVGEILKNNKNYSLIFQNYKIEHAGHILTTVPSVIMTRITFQREI